MKKRIMSMLLMLTMVFSLIVVPNTATAVTYHDTVDTDCELAVDVLDALGIMRGYTDGSFLPYNTITKAEMASVAVKLAGVNEYSEEAPDDMELFNDMYDYEGWAAGVVAMAKTMGIAQGYGNGLFGVNDPVTRQDAITIIYRAAMAKGLSVNKFSASIDKFVDKDQIAPYAYEAVSALHNAGVYLDASDPTRIDLFEPTRNASRAYLAVILNQIYMFMNN